MRTQAYQAGGGDYFRSGYYSHGLFTSAAMTTVSQSVNSLQFRAFYVPVRRGFDRIGINVTTAGTAGAVLRLGLYNGAAGVPTSLIVDAGTVDATTTGAKEVTISVTLDPGIYFTAIVAQVAVSTVSAYASTTALPWLAPDTATSAPTATTGSLGRAHAGTVTGALPNPTNAGFSATAAFAAVCLRAA